LQKNGRNHKTGEEIVYTRTEIEQVGFDVFLKWKDENVPLLMAKVVNDFPEMASLFTPVVKMEPLPAEH